MKRPVRNALALALGDVGSRLIGFGITVLLARVLLPEGFGLISLGLAILGHMSMVASPGITMLEARNAAASTAPAAERTGAVITLRLVLAALLCALVWGFVLITNPPGLTGHIMLIFAASLLPMSVFLDWYFQGKEQMGVASMARIVHYVVYALAVVLMVKSPGDVPFAAAGFLAGNWAAAVFLLIVFSIRFGKLELRWDSRLLLTILKENLPVGAGMFLAQLVVNLPPVVLGIVAGTAAVGQFSAAARIAFLFLMVDRLLNTLFLPMVSRHLVLQPDGVERLVGVVGKSILLLVTVLAAAGVILSPWLMGTIYGAEYESSFALLDMLIAFVLLTVMNSIFVCILIGGGRTREYFKVMAYSSVVLTVAVVVLTVLLGERGAVIGVVVGEAAAMLLAMGQARLVVPFHRAGILPALACAVVGILVLPVIRDSSGILATVVSSLVLLVPIVSLLGGFSRAEIRYLRERLL